MGMMHEPGWIPPARKPSRQELLMQAIYAQQEAASLYARAREQQEAGKHWQAAHTQEKAQNVQMAARFFMGVRA